MIELKDICNRVMKYKLDLSYRIATIKIKGKERILEIPNNQLYSVHKELETILRGKVTPSPNAHGYIKNRSIVTHASMHTASNEIITMDIKQYFHNCTQEKIKNFFVSEGLSKDQSDILSETVTYKGRLSTGSPCSPILSNIIFTPLDESLSKTAEYHNLTYTRYVDDLAFSGDSIPTDFDNKIENILKDHHFRLNPSKTVISNVDLSNITGLQIRDGRLQVPRKMRRKIKRAHFSLVKGNSSPSKKNINRVRGLLNFYKMVEPDSAFAIRSLAVLRSIEKKHAVV